ncbi:hypothetical protein F5Y15DRAFT_425457 [Xylariaceae sp. FL0016]|nr:hypothetical protein F5Y15DRAFT_425457 [Xylariaceae sp. FL0016]
MHSAAIVPRALRGAVPLQVHVPWFSGDTPPAANQTDVNVSAATTATVVVTPSIAAHGPEQELTTQTEPQVSSTVSWEDDTTAIEWTGLSTITQAPIEPLEDVEQAYFSEKDETQDDPGQKHGMSPHSQPSQEPCPTPTPVLDSAPSGPTGQAAGPPRVANPNYVPAPRAPAPVVAHGSNHVPPVRPQNQGPQADSLLARSTHYRTRVAGDEEATPTPTSEKATHTVKGAWRLPEETAGS